MKHLCTFHYPRAVGMFRFQKCTTLFRFSSSKIHIVSNKIIYLEKERFLLSKHRCGNVWQIVRLNGLLHSVNLIRFDLIVNFQTNNYPRDSKLSKRWWKFAFSHLLIGVKGLFKDLTFHKLWSYLWICRGKPIINIKINFLSNFSY